MGIPESQLETWSHQGATKTAKTTHESIRNALNSSEHLDTLNYEVYLQGSYKNSTNIRGDSDVDIVVQLNSVFYHALTALSEYEKILFNQTYPNATYLWPNFRTDILGALRTYYGTSVISEGNKSIKIAGGSNRLPADLVVCLQYRKYINFRNLDDEQYIEGIAFYSLNDNRFIINYPKLHYANGTEKNTKCKEWYKPTVRVFKNARTYIIDKGIISEMLAPSYFLECLIYNAPDKKFGRSFQHTTYELLNWLSDTEIEDLMCQNEQLLLFGNTPEQWSFDSANKFIQKLIELWNNWG